MSRELAIDGKEEELEGCLAIRRENPKAEPDTPRKFFRFMAVKERKSKYLMKFPRFQWPDIS